MNTSERDIYVRLASGEPLEATDPGFPDFMATVDRTLGLVAQMNAQATDRADVRTRMSEIIGRPIPLSSQIFPPFYTNLGKNIHIGENVFINHLCSFLDIAKITLEDFVMVGPRVTIITDNHPTDPATRRSLQAQPVTIERNVWLAANCTILPGVTVGENSVVAAGAVVSKDVPPNVVVAGVPAKIIKQLKPPESVSEIVEKPAV